MNWLMYPKNEDILHYGTKGMKWRYRKQSKKPNDYDKRMAAQHIISGGHIGDLVGYNPTSYAYWIIEPFTTNLGKNSPTIYHKRLKQIRLFLVNTSKSNRLKFYNIIKKQPKNVQTRISSDLKQLMGNKAYNDLFKP